MKQEVVEKRRDDIKRLMLTRISERKMAEQLGWNRQIIHAEIVSIRSEYSHRNLQEGDILIDWLMRNEERYNTAKVVLSMAIRDNDKDMMLRANKQMVELDREGLDVCQEFGVVEKQLGNFNIKRIEVSFKHEQFDKIQ